MTVAPRFTASRRFSFAPPGNLDSNYVFSNDSSVLAVAYSHEQTSFKSLKMFKPPRPVLIGLYDLTTGDFVDAGRALSSGKGDVTVSLQNGISKIFFHDRVVAGTMQIGERARAAQLDGWAGRESHRINMLSPDNISRIAGAAIDWNGTTAFVLRMNGLVQTVPVGVGKPLILTGSMSRGDIGEGTQAAVTPDSMLLATHQPFSPTVMVWKQGPAPICDSWEETWHAVKNHEKPTPFQLANGTHRSLFKFIAAGDSLLACVRSKHADPTSAFSRIDMWDVKTGCVVRTLEHLPPLPPLPLGPPTTPYHGALFISPDGSLLALLSCEPAEWPRDGSEAFVHVWDISASPRRLHCPSVSVKTAADHKSTRQVRVEFSRDNHFMYFAGYDGSVDVFELRRA